MDWGKFSKKIYEWVHEDPQNINKIGRRALIVSVSPFIIGEVIALIMIAIMKIGGVL